MESFSEKTGVTNFPIFFDGISFNENNQLALIASNLTGKLWHGAIAVFNDAKLAPNLPHVDYASVNEAGCTDLAWIDSERIAVATDAGSVDIWKLRESPVMENIIMLSEHDDICSSVDISKHSQQLLSGSYDHTIKIWDLEVDLSINTIRLHVEKVLAVSWCKQSHSIFASASEDGTLKLYDNRDSEKPASLLYHNSYYHPICIDWIDESKLCVGFSNGSIGIVDLKNPRKLENSVEAHKKAVNSVLHLEKNFIASASEDTTVKVHQMDGGATCYSDSHHTDYIQDLAFSKDNSTLYSCAWDGCVVNHSIDFVAKDLDKSNNNCVE